MEKFRTLIIGGGTANRSFFVLATLFFLTFTFCLGQTPPSSDPQALALVAKAIAALTGGPPVSGVTLNANAISIAGSDYFTGTATLQATGTNDSRVDLNVNGSTRTEIRTQSGGFPSGTWIGPSAKAQQLAQHNCWTDAAWFFPALSSLSEAANTAVFFSYVGQEHYEGLTANHIRVFKHFPWDQTGLATVDKLSVTDIYLDPVSSLPFGVAFKVHPDSDMNADIPTEIHFANYQAVNGIQVPFHIQRLLNGGLVLDLTVTSAVMNSALSLSNTPQN